MAFWSGNGMIPTHKGLSLGSSGCYNTSTPEGIEELVCLCLGCQGKKKSGSSSSIMHVGLDEVRRQLTRETIAEGRLEGTLERQEEERVKESARKLAAAKSIEDERVKGIERIDRERRAGQDVHERKEELRMRERELDQAFEMQIEAGRKMHEEGKRLLKEQYSGFGDETEINLED
ncbi:hypothetical protein DID88_003269 [Monilinia fructigena]|uniref:Uncharacterized protein n=1 Tax=Monilinia fructigena TaxID=38457 RepID=A0A395IVA6_9HELO|nr:hypothetical protein DID88_003269 [Monilinia fructigena]